VSATGLRKFVLPEKAAIYVFVVDDDARILELNRFLASYQIRTVAMTGLVYSNFDPKQLHRSHLPTAALGRFFLEGLLPDVHRRILYLDGDTWIRRDPSPLIEANIPDGKLAAVEDEAYFRYFNPSPDGRELRSYFAQLGIKWRNGYFNSGVLAASRSTWRSIMAEAHEFFAANTAACRFLDQSALNAVADNRRVRLSLQWNFQTNFRYLGIEKRIDPVIYHFNGFPKPWMGACERWTDMYEPYQQAAQSFASLNLPLTRTTHDIIASRNKWALRKYRALKSPLLARLASICLGVDAYEKSSSDTRAPQQSG